MRAALRLLWRLGLVAALLGGIVHLTVLERRPVPPAYPASSGEAAGAAAGAGSGEESDGASRAASESSRSADGSNRTGLRAAETAGSPVALFIGDTDTAGFAAVPRERTFACLTAQTMGWICNNGGQAGSGYTAAAKSEPYWRRVPGYARTYLADYVVVAGGRHDTRSPVAQRLVGAQRTLDVVKAAYPRAQVIVVGPFWVDQDPPADLLSFNTALRDETRRRSLVFVDTLRPPWMSRQDADRFVDADGVHLTRNGHEHLAGRLVDALREAGIEPAADPNQPDVALGDR